jgi:hypothetical protein
MWSYNCEAMFLRAAQIEHSHLMWITYILLADPLYREMVLQAEYGTSPALLGL